MVHSWTLFFSSGVIIQRPNQKLHVTLLYTILGLSLRVSTKRASFLQPRSNPLFTRASHGMFCDALSMTFHCNHIWMNKNDYCRVMLLYTLCAILSLGRHQEPDIHVMAFPRRDLSDVSEPDMMIWESLLPLVNCFAWYILHRDAT